MTRPADAVVSAVAPAIDALTVLRKARALIEKPEHWTQGEYARDSDGNAMSAFGDAASYCPLGAFRHATQDFDFPLKVLSAMGRAYGKAFETVWEFNDAPGRTHAEVIAAFDRAIASLESA